MVSRVASNLEAVAEAVGNLKGMSDSLDDNQYIDEIIRRAHKKAINSFDRTAAAQGAAGRLSHMYEYGTAGITRGPVKYPDPMSPAAQLWKHTLVGEAGNFDVSFVFRPALNRNPPHTTKSTGVPSKYLKKLSRRKYVFKNKAAVMELGKTVKIEASNVSKLFVPFGIDAMENRKSGNKGFVFWDSNKKGPLRTTPGVNHHGNFTSLWLTWWPTLGARIINRDASKSVYFDLIQAEKKMTADAKSKPMKSPKVTKIRMTAKAAESDAERRFGDYG